MGGIVTFHRGPKSVTITMTATNMRFADGYSGACQASASSDCGGGAIFDQGGPGQIRLKRHKVVDGLISDYTNAA